eukprot:TRINITY_DN23316_c0_g1_i1.p1 TRINITY_DN23316_c0_g1~~TRINITY_DN23316_c0_g1_i1.p1  ORF type:complete len:173 (-),score=36.42 TRINITY_DN23316_c0_g1_i1:103-621(-)
MHVSSLHVAILGRALQYAAIEMQEDKGVVMEAVKRHGWALKFAGKELQADREVVLEAVKTHSMALEYASPELREDPEIMLEALKLHYAEVKALEEAEPDPFAEEVMRNMPELPSGPSSPGRGTVSPFPQMVADAFSRAMPIDDQPVDPANGQPTSAWRRNRPTHLAMPGHVT